jgi:integrase
MGLGPYPIVTLADAREKARHAFRQILEGIDPIEDRKTRKAAAQLAVARAVTFRECAEKYIAAHEASWKNPKHAAQWPSSLRTYAYPAFGNLPVSDIDLALVLKALEPIWYEKPETASRVRGRIETVLDWATTRGYRRGDNPARWKGFLETVLPAKAKLQKVEHHAALPYREMPAFMQDLREREGVSARALEFTILTACRTGEVIRARWAEIDLADKTWTIPASRMKGGKEHRVPLADPLLRMLDSLPGEVGNDFVFVGGKTGQPLSNMALLALLKRMGRSDLTTHGFRSTFRDWASETTAYPHEICEMALAHVIKNKAEAAYRRGDLFEKRKRLMADWCRYCSASAVVEASANVMGVSTLRA